jgi:amino acid transporter
VPNAGALLGLIGIMMAFGHSFLAMSGEESLAQVNRELEYPKHKNLMNAGLVIFLYSLLFTSLVSFFGYALIPDDVRPQYFNNLISGISMYLAGPLTLKLLFQGFIVIVGFLMLAGAINTSIIGSNGVLNRVSEDGVMTDWFRAPHKRFGTTYRMINLIVILQLVAIIGSEATPTRSARLTPSVLSGRSRSRGWRCSCCASKINLTASGRCPSISTSAVMRFRWDWEPSPRSCFRLRAST